MKRPSLHASFAVVITLAVVLAGCSALKPDPTREDRAVAALEQSQERLEEVESYRADGTIRVVASADDRTEQVTVDHGSVVDVDERKMRTNSTTDGETTQSFLVDRTTYQQCPRPWGGWAVEEADSDGDWLDLTPAASQLSVLEEGSLTWNGTGTVDGREAVHLVGHPPASALDEEQAGRGSIPGLGGPNVEDVTVEFWIDRETDLPLESTLEFEVTGGDGSAHASSTMRYAEYDEPVSVELPYDEIENTYELGCPGA